MTASDKRVLPELLRDETDELLESWVNLQISEDAVRTELLGEEEIREESKQILAEIAKATDSHTIENFDDPAWDETKALLAVMSKRRVRKGLSPSDNAMFLLALKQVVIERLNATISDENRLSEEIWNANVLLDRLGLYTTEVYIEGREEIISRQQDELVELSTPVVQLWDGILALPVIGTLDSTRAQIVTESLLGEIVETGSSIAIIDITGVPTVDTLVAQHLLKTIAAAKLMGAECIISGIRPQIAQTIVHLGVDLGDVMTKASIEDAFKIALAKLGYRIDREE